MKTADPLRNRLLARLPRPEADAILRAGSVVDFAQGEILCEAGEEVEHAFFPISGTISLVHVMKDGRGIETGMVGREGACGAMSGLGIYHSTVRAVVQAPLTSLRISAAALRKLSSSRATAEMCFRYNDVLLDQARVTTACNALHKVDARFCRWILQTSDRTGDDRIILTQELLSEILGVRRASVTEAALAAQGKGAISYTRGTIKILNRETLESLACECYETSKERALR